MHCVHTVCAVARTRPSRTHGVRMSCACLACTGRDTPRQPAPGRDLTSMSRHQGNQNHVATSNRCCNTTQTTPGRDLKTGSRLRFSCPAPSQVVTSKPGRDPSWRLTYVATSASCRDLIPAHSGTSRLAWGACGAGM